MAASPAVKPITSRRAKAAYHRNPNPTISPAIHRRFERAAELQDRAGKIRESERRRRVAKEKRDMEREKMREKDREDRRKLRQEMKGVVPREGGTIGDAGIRVTYKTERESKWGIKGSQEVLGRFWGLPAAEMGKENTEPFIPMTLHSKHPGVGPGGDGMHRERKFLGEGAENLGVVQKTPVMLKAAMTQHHMRDCSSAFPSQRVSQHTSALSQHDTLLSSSRTSTHAIRRSHTSAEPCTISSVQVTGNDSTSHLKRKRESDQHNHDITAEPGYQYELRRQAEAVGQCKLSIETAKDDDDDWAAALPSDTQVERELGSCFSPGATDSFKSRSMPPVSSPMTGHVAVRNNPSPHLRQGRSNELKSETPSESQKSAGNSSGSPSTTFIPAAHHSPAEFVERTEMSTAPITPILAGQIISTQEPAFTSAELGELLCSQLSQSSPLTKRRASPPAHHSPPVPHLPEPPSPAAQVAQCDDLHALPPVVPRPSAKLFGLESTEETVPPDISFSSSGDFDDEIPSEIGDEELFRLLDRQTPKLVEGATS